MKKLLMATVLLILIAYVGNASANNGDTGTATVYKATVNQFELYNGSQWVVVSNGASSTMDIASVNSGQAVGSFFSGLTIPDGIYTQMRATISSTFTISGSVGSDGTPIYTTAAKVGGACVSSSTASDEAECVVEVPGGLPPPSADILPETLVISSGIPSHKIRLNFDVSAAIEEGAGEILFPGAVSVSVDMIAL